MFPTERNSDLFCFIKLIFLGAEALFVEGYWTLWYPIFSADVVKVKKCTYSEKTLGATRLKQACSMTSCKHTVRKGGLHREAFCATIGLGGLQR